MKRVIKADLGDYIVADPELAPTLHKFRSSGKRLFLLTNSAWDYTDAVMTLPARRRRCRPIPSWRNYFDIVIVAGAKPAFFTEQRPVPRARRRRAASRAQRTGRRSCAAASTRAATSSTSRRASACGGDRVLYIGDHIYGDMLRAKKSSVWRTAMVLQELEDGADRRSSATRSALERVEQLERQCVRLDSEITYQQLLLKSLQQLARAAATAASRSRDAAPTVEAAKHEAKRRLDELRAALKAAADELGAPRDEVDRAFNPYWGAIFREGTENSRFGEQVEDYACVYTSRVSNFLAYSPLRYFRSPRDHMPHELV